MIELIVLDFLKARGFHAYMEMPQNPPDKFLLIQKTGGGGREHIFDATIAIQSYAPTLYETAQLNEILKIAMEFLIENDEICHVELNSDYNFTDTQTKRYRYQAIYNIVHY